jgi:hypothetical protein
MAGDEWEVKNGMELLYKKIKSSVFINLKGNNSNREKAVLLAITCPVVNAGMMSVKNGKT